MRDKDNGDPLDVEIGGWPLREWSKAWQPVAGGFSSKHPELRTSVGLARAILNGRTVYILRGTEVGKGGIEKGLQRIRGPKQTGNSAYGAQMIRKHIDRLDLEVLMVGNDLKAADLTKSLKSAMIEYHDPEWNRPARRRMERVRAGVRI